MSKIRITSGDISMIGVLNDSSTAQAIWRALPIEGQANTWGDEIYFAIPVYVDEAKDARDVMNMGELAYWPPGNAFCIFFGPTPVSQGEEIRAASVVNVFGQIEGDATVFKQVADGAIVVVEKASALLNL
jgi:hypothetical protein